MIVPKHRLCSRGIGTAVSQFASATGRPCSPARGCAFECFLRDCVGGRESRSRFAALIAERFFPVYRPPRGRILPHASSVPCQRDIGTFGAEERVRGREIRGRENGTLLVQVETFSTEIFSQDDQFSQLRAL